MHTVWRDFLKEQGARLDEAGWVNDFGDPQQELDALHDKTLLCDLSLFGLLRLSGSDAEKFLQGQFSNDIREVTPTHFQLSSYSNPKGRMLANFFIHRWQDAYWLQAAAELSNGLMERLKKYRLMAKVEVEDMAEQWVRVGIAGPEAARTIETLFGPELLPAQSYDSSGDADRVVLRLPWQNRDAFIVMSSPAPMRAFWNAALESGMVPAGVRPWRLLQIRAGFPFVQAGTVEQFIPQELNLEALGAINFKKGCYPGQEIVARTKYLGRLKSNTYRLESPVNAEPGTDIFGTTLGDQAIGKILDMAPTGAGKYEALAVLRNDNAGEKLTLGAPDGVALACLELPSYAL